jgi:hypothetical protein
LLQALTGFGETDEKQKRYQGHNHNK